jgi:hypothetical protein
MLVWIHQQQDRLMIYLESTMRFGHWWHHHCRCNWLAGFEAVAASTDAGPAAAASAAMQYYLYAAFWATHLGTLFFTTATGGGSYNILLRRGRDSLASRSKVCILSCSALKM